MSDTTFAVEFRAFSFATEAEAKAFEEKLQDAFCAMPEADGVAAVSRVVKQNDPFAGVGIIPPPGPHVNFAEMPALPAAPTFTAADLERAWQPIETAPDADGLLHVRAVWVHDATTGKRLYFDAVAGYLEGGEFVTASGDDYGWRPEDYTYWMPLPEPPADLAQRVKE